MKPPLDISLFKKLFHFEHTQWKQKSHLKKDGFSDRLFGRDGVIRTHDPLHPMQVRYQAALRPDERNIITEPTRFLPLATASTYSII